MSVTSEDVGTTLWDFMQRAFIGEDMERALPTVLVEQWLFERLESLVPISVEEVCQWPRAYGAAAFELISQYVMFTAVNPDLPYPSDFLDGCGPQQLGPAVLAWFAEHRWPFPQLLHR
jgi:hypothetical protein